ncbi:MAG: hypothetical protein AAFQ08_01390 [Bacteroidota bacterium]
MSAAGISFSGTSLKDLRCKREEKRTIFMLIEKMLTNKKFKDFFEKM